MNLKWIPVRFRDAVSTWPGFDVTVRLLPWQWSFRGWNDWDCTASWTLELGPIRVEFWANRPMFTFDA